MGCAGSLARHAQTIRDPTIRADVEAALGELERLEQEGWLRRIATGACGRTYQDVPAETRRASAEDVIGGLVETPRVETTPGPCRAALDGLERIARTRDRLESERAETGVVEAFRRAVSERAEVADPCPSAGDDLRDVIAAIVRREHEVSVTADGTFRVPGASSTCHVATLGGSIALGPRSAGGDGERSGVRGWVERVLVLRGALLREQPRAESRSSGRASARAEEGSVTWEMRGRAPWLAAPEGGPWGAAPAVYVEAVSGLLDCGASIDAYVVVLAADGWRVVDVGHLGEVHAGAACSRGEDASAV